MTPFSDRTVLDSRPGIELARVADVVPGVQVARFKIKHFGVAADHLNCVTWDGTTAGVATVLIAKSWRLRKSPFDGQQIGAFVYVYLSDTRRLVTHAPSGVFEYQLVIPRYAEFFSAIEDRDEIYATKGPLRGSGVMYEGEELPWLDLNLDGRAWARDNDQTP